MWLGAGGWLQCDPFGATIRSHPLQARPVAASDAADVLRGLLSQRIGSLTCLLMTCRHLLPTKSGCKPNWLSQHVVVDDPARRDVYCCCTL